MKAFRHRLERLEETQQPVDKEEWITTMDGAEYDLPPTDGGYVVLVRNGQPIKAWAPASLWDAR